MLRHCPQRVFCERAVLSHWYSQCGHVIVGMVHSRSQSTGSLGA